MTPHTATTEEEVVEVMVAKVDDMAMVVSCGHDGEEHPPRQRQPQRQGDSGEKKIEKEGGRAILRFLEAVLL